MGSSSSKKVIYAALIGNSLIALTKFTASKVTGSSAMLSEGIHSIVDTGNQLLLLYGIHQSKKPPDEQFPFGHGKEIYFWSFIVAILIFAVGAGISIYEGFHQIADPVPMKNPIVNYIVLAFSMIFEGAALGFALREFSRVKGKLGYIEAVHRGKDPSMFVVLFEDAAAMLGLIVAFSGILFSQLSGIPQFDGIASVIIGIILGGVAIWLAYETKGLLIGESANKKVVLGIRNILQFHKEIEHVNEVLTMHMGPDFILVNLSVNFKETAMAAEIESTVSSIDKEIKYQYPLVKRIFIEGEAKHSKEKFTPPGEDSDNIA